MAKHDELTIAIRSDGTIQWIDDEALSELPSVLGVNATRQRASHIEPVSKPLRCLFRAIRSKVADESMTAAWTRRWKCRWQVQIVDGPTWGRYEQRADAIAAEVRWLKQNRI